MYGNSPGTPPGSKRMKNNSLNHTGLIPKKFPRPPQIPATTRSFLDRRNTFVFSIYFTFIPFT
jgi:hypothetical protein